MTEAYVTLATSDQYALGALVLAHSIRSGKTTRQLCVLITPTVSVDIRSQLNDLFDNVVCVDVLDSKDSAHLALLKRPELGVTFTKLHCWALINYTKCVFLDADMLNVQNADELFDQPELSAACDIGWPDCFNSGMFVFSPSLETYNKLLQHAQSAGSFDGGDQGLLNTFFTNWNRLSFAYNMVASVCYTYLPAYKQYGRNVKFVHFLGETKPWHQTFNYQSGTITTQPGQEHISCHLNTWWRIFTTLVQPGLPKTVCSPSVEVETSFHNYQHSQEYHDTGCNTFYIHPTHTYENENFYSHQVITNDQVKTHDQGQYNQTNIQDTELSLELCCQTSVHAESHDLPPLPLPSIESVPIAEQILVYPSPPTPSQYPLTPASLEQVDEVIQEIKLEETLPVHVSDPVPDTKATETSDFLNQLSREAETSTDPLTQLYPETEPFSEPNFEPSSQPIVNISAKFYFEPSYNDPLPKNQPPNPTNMVPELRHTFEPPSNPTGSRLLFGVAGRRGVPPARFGSPFQPLICPRVPSPFSGHRAASAVSAHGPYELSQQLAGVSISTTTVEESRKRWEQGRPDYLGEDAFANIQAYLDAKIKGN